VVAGNEIELQIVVRDTGIGISQANLNRLFQPFSQLDSSNTRRYGGTGLGLAISKRLAELMGGTIRAESKEGSGSTFYLTLPTTALAWLPEDVVASPNPLLANRTAVVLDDNQDTLDIFRRYLEYWGMKVIGYTTIGETAKWLQESPAPDLLIIDSRLAGENGLAFAATMHTQHPTIPIILLTSIVDTHLRIENQRSGLDRFLVKPVKPLELFEMLTNIFGAPAPQAVQKPATASIADDMGTRFPLRILLAEDNLLNQKVALRMLKRLGYDADVATDGREALRAIENQRADCPYDVVLMDVQMPEMDGLEATKQIRAIHGNGSHQPYIIAMTAAAMELDREKCLEAGMNDFVSKPATLEDLQRAILRYLGQLEST